MKLILLLGLCCCMTATYVTAQISEYIDVEEQETRRQRYFRPERVFVDKLTEKTMSSRYDFRNRKPDEIDINPCPPTMRCVHGTCGSVKLRWGAHIEFFPAECHCDDGYSGPTCEVNDATQVK